MEKVMLKPRLAIDGTRSLTNPERGVYWDLINLMYLLGDAIHDDDRWLAGHCNLHTRSYRLVRQSLIDKGKIRIRNDGKLIANHVGNELKSCSKYLELRRKLGELGGNQRAENLKNKDLDQALAKAPAKPTLPPSLSKKDISSKSDASDASDPFEDWWSDCPRKIGKGQARRAFAAALRKTDGDSYALDYAGYVEAERARGQAYNFIKHPATWLNGECWNDDEGDTAGGKQGRCELDIDLGECLRESGVVPDGRTKVVPIR